MRGDSQKGEYVGIIYDVRTSGETITCPNHRIPSFRQPHHKKLIMGMVRSRGLAGIHDGDLYFNFDGGKHGNSTPMLNNFADDDGRMSKEVFEVFVCFTEASIVERYRKQSSGMVQQEDQMHIVSRYPVNLNGRAGKHYPGTNRGSILCQVSLQSYKDPTFWKLSAKDKKAIFGKDHRIAVGGTSPPGYEWQEDARAELRQGVG
eukprot:4735955-Pyramimonas_sp.AAC.1